MNTQIVERLKNLKSEFEAGQKRMADLEAKQASVRDTLLRISGAIQVLEELLSASRENEENGSKDPEDVYADVVT